MDVWRFFDVDFGFEGLVFFIVSMFWMDGFLLRFIIFFVVLESLFLFIELRLGLEVNSGLFRIILRDFEVKGLGLFSLRFFLVF